MNDFRLTFGKHKGEMFKSTPLNYQKWLLEQDWFKPVNNEPNITNNTQILKISSNDIGDWSDLYDILQEKRFPFFEFEGDLEIYASNWDDEDTKRLKTIFKRLISVSGDLEIDAESPLTSLGSLTNIGGNFSIQGCPDLDRLTSLGNLKKVGGSISIYDTYVKTLNKLEFVGGGLCLNNMINSLGNLKKVGDSIHLDESELLEIYTRSEILKMVEIGGTLYGDDIVKLSYKDFDNNWNNLQDFLIKENISTYIIKDDLDLSNTKIKNLGHGCLRKVEGNLNLSNTKIENLNGLLRVGGELNLSECNVEIIEGLISVGGELNLKNMSLFKPFDEDDFDNTVPEEGFFPSSSTLISVGGKITLYGGDIYNEENFKIKKGRYERLMFRSTPLCYQFNIIGEEKLDDLKPEIVYNNHDDNDYYEKLTQSYDRYGQSYEKFGGYNGYSDDEIWDIFEGDPENSWNID
jgi:hypothetical protein